MAGFPASFRNAIFKVIHLHRGSLLRINESHRVTTNLNLNDYPKWSGWGQHTPTLTDAFTPTDAYAL